MVEIIYDTRKSFTIAESIAELTGKQFVLLSGLIHSNLTVSKARLAALKILCNKGWFGFKRIPNDAKFKSLPYVDWVFEDWQNSVQALPLYKKMYGPKSELINLCLSEFHFTENAYSDYVSTKEIDFLNQLCAILYRPAKHGYDFKKDLEGDCRQPFNANAIAYYSTITAKWPMAVKQAILLFYDGCRSHLVKEYPEIFNAGSSSNDSDGDLFEMIRGLAGDKYGDFDKVEALPLHTALREIQCILAENARLEAQIK
jgi:hypothetical protein